jgi:hypothetical protein
MPLHTNNGSVSYLLPINACRKRPRVYAKCVLYVRNRILNVMHWGMLLEMHYRLVVKMTLNSIPMDAILFLGLEPLIPVDCKVYSSYLLVIAA